MSIKDRIELEYHKFMLSLKMRQVARENMKSIEIVKDTVEENSCES